MLVLISTLTLPGRQPDSRSSSFNKLVSASLEEFAKRKSKHSLLEASVIVDVDFGIFWLFSEQGLFEDAPP